MPLRQMNPQFVADSYKRDTYDHYGVTRFGVFLTHGETFNSMGVYFVASGFLTATGSPASIVDLVDTFGEAGKITIGGVEIDLSRFGFVSFNAMTGVAFSSPTIDNDPEITAAITEIRRLYQLNRNRLWTLELDDGVPEGFVTYRTGGVKVATAFPSSRRLRPTLLWQTGGVAQSYGVHGGYLNPLPNIRTGGVGVSAAISGGNPSIRARYRTGKPRVSATLTGGLTVKVAYATGKPRVSATLTGGLTVKAELKTGGSKIAVAFREGPPLISVLYTSGGSTVSGHLTGKAPTIKATLTTGKPSVTAVISGGPLVMAIAWQAGGARFTTAITGGTPFIVALIASGGVRAFEKLDAYTPHIVARTKAGPVKVEAAITGGPPRFRAALATGGVKFATFITGGLLIRATLRTGGVRVTAPLIETILRPKIRYTTGGARVEAHIPERYPPYQRYYTLDANTGLRINEIRTLKGDSLRQRLLDRMFVEQGTRALRPEYGTLPANGDTLPELAGDSIRDSFLSDEKVDAVQWHVEGRRMVFDISAEVKAVIAV